VGLSDSSFSGVLLAMGAWLAWGEFSIWAAFVLGQFAARSPVTSSGTG